MAAVRSFVQLTAIGYVIKPIFKGDKLVFVFLLSRVMVLFGALTARTGRGRCRAPSGRC